MNELYYTQSLNLASYVMSKGFQPVGKRVTNGKTTIYFNKTDSLHDAVREYNNDQELKKFIAAFRELKIYIHN